MKKTITIFLCSLFASTLYTCVDVVEVELQNAAPQTVIEANLYDRLRPATVLISKSAEFFGVPELEFISGAEVYIIDEAGNETRLFEADSASLYIADFRGQAGMNYSLKVKTNENEFSAESQMTESIAIDSMTIVPLSDFGIPSDEYGLYCHFTNPKGQRDYFQFRLYRNSQPVPFLYLIDDFFFDGLSFDFFFYTNYFEEGDTAFVEMLTMDAPVYDYLYELSEVAGGSGTGTATPYNPTSNINNNALGYFGAFGYSVSMLIIEEGNVSVQYKNHPAIRKFLERKKTGIFPNIKIKP